MMRCGTRIGRCGESAARLSALVLRLLIDRDKYSFPKEAEPLLDDGFAQGSLNTSHARRESLHGFTDLASLRSLTSMMRLSSMRGGVHFQGAERGQVDV